MNMANVGRKRKWERCLFLKVVVTIFNILYIITALEILDPVRDA